MNEIYVRATIYCATGKETFGEAWDELAVKLARMIGEDKDIEIYIDGNGSLRCEDGKEIIDEKKF